MIILRSCGTTERPEDNERTTVSAQKNAIFSLQRFYGLEKEFREETELYAQKKSPMFFTTALLWKNNKGPQGITTKKNLTILG